VGITLAGVLAHFGADFVRHHPLSAMHERAWRAIVSCRTPALGGQRMRCDACAAEHWRYNSCRNRHCPTCQCRARDQWRAERVSELLNVPYCHLVFTLPHELNALAAAHPRWVYDTLMQCTAATLNEFAANPRWLGGVGAFSLVLHTWTQDLRRHLHVHALMACGAMALDASGQGSWLTPKRSPTFLFPVQALSKVFRGKFMLALQHAIEAGALPRDPATTPAMQHQRTLALRKHEWVVYAKTPLDGAPAVLEYLARYTHRTAIGNERLVGIKDGQVLMRVRADSTGGKRVIAMPGMQFIGRFLQHVLPLGFKRIRHYGLLAPAAKTARLQMARQLLDMPAANPAAREDAQAFMRRVAAIEISRCPHCPSGRWLVVEQRMANSVAIKALVPTPCRGPP
jgi:hypothetical protein